MRNAVLIKKAGLHTAWDCLTMQYRLAALVARKNNTHDVMHVAMHTSILVGPEVMDTRASAPSMI